MQRSFATALLIGALSIPSIAEAGTLPCFGDLDGDRTVGLGDLGILLAAYDTCEGDTFYDPLADLDESGCVDLSDLALLLALYGTACPDAVLRAELAGSLLAEYPYFEYVRAFTQDSVVEAAIDPTRFPDVVGRTCEIYLVRAKDELAWRLDPALIDVRVGGAQTETFGGATIQENAFLIADAWELDADAGTGFGVGYDVVLDVDRDGLLSDGDYIDGLSDEAGLYVVHDTTGLGPRATTSIVYSGGVWLGQKTWYPTEIASLGRLPLVVISHGNGHQYTWYDYLQEHLASYGYVVMSHQNNTAPGIESASTTTLANTDYFLGNLDSIGDGVLAGHVDGTRITWIGHSRGGEGVVRAYDRLFDGAYVPLNYTLSDIVLVSSIAPNDYLGRHQSNPHSVNYHLLHGTADGDNGGWPDRESDAPFHLFERAVGNRQVTHVQGADHNDFNCCGWDDFTGPPGTAIGRPEAQRVAKAAYLALVKHYVDGNIPARDFLWRQYETLRPVGVAPTTIVDREYVEGPREGVFLIDDFQSEPSLMVSSSGGAVTFDVQNPWEGLMDDADGTFTWNPTDPMNGMSRARPDDLTRGLVFDWSVGTERYLEFEVVPAARDFSRYAYLSFRACQGTRHPETIAELGDLTFTVSLRDGAGVASSIEFGAYGAGIEEPYQRTGSGVGAGWQNEFETIRIRLTDFMHNGTGIDLTHIDAVRFGFGSPFGSVRGRIGFDDLALSAD